MVKFRICFLFTWWLVRGITACRSRGLSIEPAVTNRSVRTSNLKIRLTTTLSAWPLPGLTALKSISWETLFLDQLHDFSLLSSNSFLDPFMKSKFPKKISWHQNNFIFEVHSNIFSKVIIFKPVNVCGQAAFCLTAENIGRSCHVCGRGHG